MQGGAKSTWFASGSSRRTFASRCHSILMTVSLHVAGFGRRRSVDISRKRTDRSISNIIASYWYGGRTTPELPVYNPSTPPLSPTPWTIFNSPPKLGFMIIEPEEQVLVFYSTGLRIWRENSVWMMAPAPTTTLIQRPFLVPSPCISKPFSLLLQVRNFYF